MIDYDTFRAWAEEHFPECEVVGDELKINSIFTHDDGRHLWCNPSKNAYHCWKSDAHGNLFDLVSQKTGCSYFEAVSLLANDNSLRTLEARLDKFFGMKAEAEPVKEAPKLLALPSDTHRITDLSGFHREIADKYLTDRKIDVGNLMYCVGGQYRNRIIIPYYGPDGTLIYWNSRDVTGKSKARYLGPDKEVGVGKGDVIYARSWPKGGKVYLTEGEFDALSLCQCGLTGMACGGKALVERQVDLLRPYAVCICFDTDKSGEVALHKIGDKLIESGMRDVCFVRPPVDASNPSKKMDWNRMLVEYGEKVTELYVTSQEKPFTYWTSKMLRFNNR